MNTNFALEIAGFLALIAVLTYMSVAVAPEPLEDADAGPTYALAR
jgi:hypothetical protein